MSVIFKREDFLLCVVPVPKGYPQSQTHTGVVISGGKYYLTTSPYPNPKRSILFRYFSAIIRKLSFRKINLIYRGEDYENPMLYEAINFTNDNIATGFKLVKGSPLMQKPEDKFGAGSFCSDPDLSFFDGKIHVLNRTTIRGNQENDGETIVHLIKGYVDNNTFVEESLIHLFKESYKSPCLTKIGNRYCYFCLDTNSYNDGEPCKALLLRESDDMTNWSDQRRVQLNNGMYEPWHMSVFNYGERLFAVIACIKKGESHRCWQMLGEFNETLSDLKIYQTPLTDYKSYRGSACVTNDGEFILYNTTVREKIKKSNSVDGRDVIMAHMPFEKLVNTLKDREK